MRLHDLSITAFGPFVDTVHVDFDELASGGLFLLTGDTGAGKTSVLDAVCFALYGEVPGARHNARHLRSDHAEDAAAPRVVLEVSVAARRFRFSRSPSWHRPKRRGTGTTKVQAHVVVEELRDGDWQPRTNRLDEAGHLVSDLLGMTCTQFTQVAMLPQGRFQAFLRASSTERHEVLQRLFRTRRYEDVERWLVDRRVELRRRCQTHHDACAGVLNRFQEAAGSGVPQEWDPLDLDGVATDGSLERWAAACLTDAATASEECTGALVTATSAVIREQRALDAARALLECRRRGEQASRRLEALQETRAQDGLLRVSLDAHRRAGSVLPQTQRVAQARDQHLEIQEHSRDVLQRACRHLGLHEDALDAQVLAAETTRLGEERAVASSWLPRDAQLREARTRVGELSEESTRLADRLASGEHRADELATARGAARAALEEALPPAQRVSADRAAVEVAAEKLAAATESARLATNLTQARERLSEATSLAQQWREAYLDLRERRIVGMAAELATALAVGCSCPVCGSVDHPFPASAAGGVSRGDEEQARERYETADFERQTVQDQVTTLETRHSSVLERAEGRDVAAWSQVLELARASAAESIAAERRVADLRAGLITSEEQERVLLADLASIRIHVAERTREHREMTARHDVLSEELADLLAGHTGLSTVPALVEHHRRLETELSAAHTALTVRDRAAAALAAALAAADHAATEAAFASIEEAMAAVLPDSEATARTTRLEKRRSTSAAAQEVLAETEVTAALTAEIPDLGALSEHLADTTRERDRLHAEHDHGQRRAQRLRVLLRELGDRLLAWAPTRHEHATTAALASLVEGKNTDNQLRMRLSAYVLSERLRQVVASANERLGPMTGERYTLEQADEKGAGEQRGGLSLRVRDEWSGKQRDPATLSGGETFLVSLALALGLADTVSHEAGGIQLDTLFIDEGFGALDATTLDAVMDTLDALRDGGRVVGLVSHVSELRNRVPAQLEVLKARHGSTVRTRIADS